MSNRERSYPEKGCLSRGLRHYLGGKKTGGSLEEREYAKILWPKEVHDGSEDVKEGPCGYRVESEVWSEEK